LVGTTMAPHGSAAEHRDSPTGAAVDRSARHPRDPVHIEASTVEFQPGCPLCVLQLQTVSILRASRASLPALTPRSFLPPTAQQAHPPLPKPPFLHRPHPLPLRRSWPRWRRRPLLSLHRWASRLPRAAAAARLRTTSIRASR